MADGIQFIDSSLVAETLVRAQSSPRRRMNHNLHSGPGDNPHRFLNVFLQYSYVVPHRHAGPPKSETFLVLDGVAALFRFDGAGVVTGRWLLSPQAPDDSEYSLEYGGFGIDVAPGVWHTITALTPTAVCFEVKPGPWNPASDKEFAPWAPREDDPGAAAYLQRLLA
jgi:cupin fold WbuC family metalloprotein